MSQPPFIRAEIPPGTLIDNRYMIQRLLGQGGLGRTYLAEDTRRFNELCVLKEFAPNGTGEHGLEKSRNLFKREAKILHQVEHPQIPKFLACFEGDGRLFLVQEFVDGKAYSTLLRERQSQGQTFHETEVIDWLKKLLPVLHYIHSCGIIHRDISPDNIMLPNGRNMPVLIDFGVGKQMEDLSDSSGANHGFVGKMSLVGKVGYAPREQISLGRCSPSSDLYALGVTAIVLLTGRDPSQLMDQFSLEWRWRSMVQVSDALAYVLDRMLVDTPKNRYQSVEEVLTDLNVATPSTHSAAAPSSPSTKIMSADPADPGSEPSIADLFAHSWAADSAGERLGEQLAKPPSELPGELLSGETMISGETIVSLPDNAFSSQPPPLPRSAVPPSAAPPPSVTSTRAERPQITPGFIERCQRELAFCIGPMASFVIEEVIAQQAPATVYQLVEALEQEIPDEQEAIAFRRRMLT